MSTAPVCICDNDEDCPNRVTRRVHVIDGTDVIILCANGHWWQPTNVNRLDRCECTLGVPLVTINCWSEDPS